MTEYILIVALIALIAIVGVQLFGKQIREQFDKLTSDVAKVNAS